MADVSRAIKLCGTDEADPPSRLLRAGPLSVELEAGNLRYIRFSGIEVLRGISFLVRDANWGYAFLNVFGSVVAGFLAVLLGVMLVAMVFPRR